LILLAIACHGYSDLLTLAALRGALVMGSVERFVELPESSSSRAMQPYASLLW
jgi:hypothetical protein